MIRELNVVRKHGRASYLHIAIAYPSTYIAGMSSLVTHLLYFLLNGYDEVIAERVFHSYPEDVKVPKLRSLEWNRRLRDFDIVLFSVHYEIDYANIVEMLYEANIPVFSRDRGEKDPVIIVGGPSVTANPEPLADIADAVVIGEAEGVVKAIVEKYFSSRSRREFIESLADIRGVYVPSLGKHMVLKNYVENLDEAFYPVRQIQPLNYELAYGRGLLVESTRGCKWHCQFCMEGFISKPKRDRSYSKIVEIIEKGLEINGLSRVIFYALSFFDHEYADKILEYLIERNIEASIPSLRPNTLTEYRLDLISKLGQKTLTIAPETLCPALGLAIKKFMREEQIKGLVKKAYEKGISAVKMYFIVGFPHQGLEEALKIIEFMKKLKSEVKGIQLKLSLNPLIPKPHTPLQWLPIADTKITSKKLKLIASELRKLSIETSFYSPKWALVQASIALGDRGIGKAIAEWSLGSRTPTSWIKVVRKLGISLDYVLKGRSLGETLPWDHIDLNISRKFLEKSYEFFIRNVSRKCEV